MMAYYILEVIDMDEEHPSHRLPTLAAGGNSSKHMDCTALLIK